MTSELIEMLKEIESIRNQTNRLIQVKGMANQEVINNIKRMNEKIREYNRLLDSQIQ
jgi:hypothetical protein